MIEFKRDWFTQERLTFISQALPMVSHPSGVNLRLTLIGELRGALSDERTLVADPLLLKAWAIGCLGAWVNERCNDTERYILLESAKAFRCEMALRSMLPRISIDDFTADPLYELEEVSPADIPDSEEDEEA
jgi:hypothetical protein